MLSTSNVAIQFGAKPLFEHVSVKFSDGNRYGLIGANGCGKSTLMKVLGGELEPSAGDVMLQAGMRLGQAQPEPVRLRRRARARRGDAGPRGDVAGDDRSATASTPNAERHRRRLHARRRARGEVRRVRRLRRRSARRPAAARTPAFAEVAAQRPDARSGAGPEAARAARAGAVLEAGRAAARRADQQPRHQLDPLARGRAQRLRRHHDHHQPRPALPEPGVHAHGGSRLPAAQDLSRQLRRLHARLDAGARSAWKPSNAKAKDRISDLQEFVRRFSANASKSRQATSRKRQIEKIKIEEVKPSSRQNPYIRFEQAQEAVPLGGERGEARASAIRARTSHVLKNVSFNVEAGERIAIIGPNGIGKTTLMRCLAGELQARPRAASPGSRTRKSGYMPQDPQAEFAEKVDLFTWMSDVDRQGGRRADRARDARPAAVLRRRDQEVGARCSRAARRAA